jgi:GAF domain-containing protein
MVALRKDDSLLGAVTVYRQEARPFSQKQIALLQNFAAQAVIAMENARLLTETREALEQQTATAEVLQVINSSPGDLAPVFDAMLEKALRLCGASFGVLRTYDGDKLHPASMQGVPEAYAEFARGPITILPGTAAGRIRDGADFVHAADLREDEGYKLGAPAPQALVHLGGARSYIGVALRKESQLLGTIGIYRQEVRPFTDKEIALLQNFAAHAVIAMENARLLTETHEALEQQTATAEVLQVINSSPGELAPVFDAMLEKAVRLCNASFGTLVKFDGEYLHVTASHDVPPRLAEFLRTPRRVEAGTPIDRMSRGERFVHVPDVTAVPQYIASNTSRAYVELGGARTLLVVPLRKDGTVLGAIVAYRQEVRPFTEKQIALLENFAAQAVIAMENARLLTETREALEQQTATAEVLQVINSSPGHLAPVFDAMLEKATRLNDAAFGILSTISDSGIVSHRAFYGTPALAEVYGKRAPSRAPVGGTLDRLINGERCPQVDDATKGDLALRDERRRVVELAEARTIISVGLYKDNLLIGAISLYRREVRRFSEREIAVLENFAAQAVIAMENARLLTETSEALEQQTATAEVLQVINSSPGDLAPVFDAMLEKALHLCSSSFGFMADYDGEYVRVVAERGIPAELAEFHREPYRVVAGTPMYRFLQGEEVFHVVDAISDPSKVSARGQAYVDLGGARSFLAVPMRKDGGLLGCFLVFRQHVEAFSAKQIALLQNFAAQAVIAMENARLLTETREALEHQTATAEILEVINRSPGNLAPVYKVILEKAHNLCGVGRGTLQLYDGEYLRVVAAHAPDVPGEFVDRLRQGYRASDYALSRPLLDGARSVHIADLAEIDDPLAQTFVELAGTRSVLFVPLRREGALLGLIASARQEVRPFSEKEIGLLESFAAQAVIAMDNARLLNEIRQRQAELRVTFDNMGDGVAMFDAELRLAAWNLNFQRILELPDTLLAERPRVADFVRYLAVHGEYGAVDIEAEVRRLSERAGTQWSAERTRPDGQVIEVRSNPVPGGGVVLIYSDITERKRAEAEIRSARDTAERALQELQTAQASLLHAQKMAALGQLTAGIAHEIKNPLNFVNNFAELSGELLLELTETTAPAVATLGDDERAAVDEVVEMLRGNLDKITEHGKRADGIVKSMLEHSRGVSGERRAVDLNALIEEALNLAYHGARAQDASFNITLEREFDHGLGPTELAPQEMTRVFLNLFGNGFYATNKRQQDGASQDFRPTLKVATRDLGDVVEVRVRDNGTGISPEIRDKLFQPFVTTKPTGEGTGLGLSVAWDIVTQQHGGTIAVDSVPDEFTEFTVRLPRTHLATADGAS